MVVRTCKLTIQNSKISAAIDYNEWIAWRLQNHTKTSWNRAAGGGIWVTYRTVAGPHSRRGSAGPAASRRDLYRWNRRHGWHLSVSVAAGFVEQKQELNLNQRYSRSPLAWKGKDLGREKNNLIDRLVKLYIGTESTVAPFRTFSLIWFRITTSCTTVSHFTT
jgi:hypothetical protein